MEEINIMNYDEELKTLEKNTTNGFWKPNSGNYEVLVLEEPKDHIYTDKTKKEIPQWKILIRANGELYNWALTKTKTVKSTYGQLLAIASKFKKLNGLTLKITVFNNGSKREYVISGSEEILKERKLRND